MQDITLTHENIEAWSNDVGTRISEALPNILRQLLLEHADLSASSLQLECSLLRDQQAPGNQLQSVKLITFEVGTPIRLQTPRGNTSPSDDLRNGHELLPNGSIQGSPVRLLRQPTYCLADVEARSVKRRATGKLKVRRPDSSLGIYGANPLLRSLDGSRRASPQKKQRSVDNPTLQPSTLDKLISGVWDSIFSDMRLDPIKVVEQWRTIESGGQPRLLLDSNHEVAAENDSTIQGVFGRMNVLTRNISQTSRACRSLEVIVQSHWVQVFDDRVNELGRTMTKERAKKTALSEACVDFQWSEKELRNKMAIWRGYHEIKNAGGWVALVFAGTGLYRFCKYRTFFSDNTFETLSQVRHRFEVAADTLHPHWRSLLAIVGCSTERKYVGHPHDWVVCGPDNGAIPLPTTYQQWDENFSYNHLDASIIEEDAWGTCDPRSVVPLTDHNTYQCPTCNGRQSDDPRQNACTCFPSLYGRGKAGPVPVQVFRTPSGKNNGLIACCGFESGAAVGEFIGQITAGLSNTDVMVGETDQAVYQIWQGKQGNHTRFVNHSCHPNSQYERFVWQGTQRIVLVSKGIEAGEEVVFPERPMSVSNAADRVQITVDYSDTYWENLDKECLCGEPNCRFRGRQLDLS